MPSSFKGLDLFGSGPHRFAVAKEGNYILFDEFTGDTDAGGLIDLDVVVTGRLVAASEPALWSLRDAITGQIFSNPAGGTLVDLHGRSWSSMVFIGFTPGDRTDRGRRRSLSYKAVFRRYQ